MQESQHQSLDDYAAVTEVTENIETKDSLSEHEQTHNYVTADSIEEILDSKDEPHEAQSAAKV